MEISPGTEEEKLARKTFSQRKDRHLTWTRSETACIIPIFTLNYHIFHHVRHEVIFPFGVHHHHCMLVFLFFSEFLPPTPQNSAKVFSRKNKTAPRTCSCWSLPCWLCSRTVGFTSQQMGRRHICPSLSVSVSCLCLCACSAES